MKKRLIALLLILVLAVPAVAAAVTYYHVNTSRVESRYLPDVNATVLDSYRQDWALTLVKKYGTWWRVRFTNGEEGYVQSKYVTKSRSYNAWITQNDTELRTGPDYSFASVAQLAKGTKVAVRSHGSSYDYVVYGNLSGYVRNAFLSKKRVAADKNTTTKPFTAYITSKNGRSVNVRNGGGMNYGVIGSFKPGTEVTVEKKGTTWSQVVANGLKGWVMTQYLTTSKAAVTDIPQPIATNTPVVCPYYAYVVSQNGGYVNVHRGAGDGYANATTASVGTLVVVLEHGLTWDKIRIDSKGSVEGWIRNEYLSQNAPANNAGGDENPTNDAYQAFITSPDGKSVNLRRGPGTGYSVIAAYPIGTPITVISRAKAWSVVEVDGRRGYIRNDLITEAQPAPTATPVPVPTEVPADVTPEPTAVPGSATVWSANGLSVNVHRGPGTGYSNVTRVSPGDVVYVLSYVSSKWAKIQLMDGREGYIKTEFLK